ncbi:Receptor expression-enhancing protein [Aphelenchoides fujianensis]|nr:Receptor expression-enhancing protein [Aphelenchoides fujianensis]
MISILFSRLAILVCGMLYPAYKSFKAVRLKDAKEYMKWMMYWIAFAIFCVAESFADIFVSFWFPFYYELKILFILWLVSPWTKGGTILYRKASLLALLFPIIDSILQWIHPTLMKHEEEIDVVIQKAGQFGRRALVYAQDIVRTAALRGHTYLVPEGSEPAMRSGSRSDNSLIESMSE